MLESLQHMEKLRLTRRLRQPRQNSTAKSGEGQASGEQASGGSSVSQSGEASVLPPGESSMLQSSASSKTRSPTSGKTLQELEAKRAEAEKTSGRPHVIQIGGKAPRNLGLLLSPPGGQDSTSGGVQMGQLASVVAANTPQTPSASGGAILVGTTSRPQEPHRPVWLPPHRWLDLRSPQANGSVWTPPPDTTPFW